MVYGHRPGDRPAAFAGGWALERFRLLVVGQFGLKPVPDVVGLVVVDKPTLYISSIGRLFLTPANHPICQGQNNPTFNTMFLFAAHA
jgi:hypothetical protein